MLEVVLERQLGQPQINASQRNRMAIAGRDVLRWLAQPHILNSTRAEFEALLLQIADEVEEWLTSAETLGITRPRTKVGVQSNGRVALTRVREAEWGFELG